MNKRTIEWDIQEENMFPLQLIHTHLARLPTHRTGGLSTVNDPLKQICKN